LKTSDLRKCDGIGRAQLEARLRECADLIDAMFKYHQTAEIMIAEEWGDPCVAVVTELGTDEAIEHFENFENFKP
jgi:hypothetical protein